MTQLTLMPPALEPPPDWVQPLGEWMMAETNFRGDENRRCRRCARDWNGHAGSKCYPQAAGDLSLFLPPLWHLVVDPEPPWA